MKRFLQVSGNNLIIGLEGRKSEIETEFYSFWLYGAASNPHWFSDNFLYFWSTYLKLIKAISSRLEANFYQKTGLTLECPGIQEKHKTKAKEIIEKTYEKERFLNITSLEEYKIEKL